MIGLMNGCRITPNRGKIGLIRQSASGPCSTNLSWVKMPEKLISDSGAAGIFTTNLAVVFISFSNSFGGNDSDDGS